MADSLAHGEFALLSIFDAHGAHFPAVEAWGESQGREGFKTGGVGRDRSDGSGSVAILPVVSTSFLRVQR